MNHREDSMLFKNESVNLAVYGVGFSHESGIADKVAKLLPEV